MRQLLRFAWVEAQCCLFAVLFFVGLAVVRLVDLPLNPADALLLWSLVVTPALWALRWETGREVAVIFGFHLVGLALELFKVHQGSWSYPDITSHVTVDVRLPLALALLVVTRRTWVHFTVGVRRYAMPLALSFGLIGFFLWAAENAATFLRAWQYPSQESVWTVVHAAKLGSWSLLVVVSIVLVAAVKAYEGRLYGSAHDLTVSGAARTPRWLPRPVIATGVVEPVS